MSESISESIHNLCVTSGVATVTVPDALPMTGLKTIYDYASSCKSRAQSFSSSSYASISSASSVHVTPMKPKMRHVTRIKGWVTKQKSKILTKLNNPATHPSTTLACLHQLIESMDVPLVDTQGELTHWPVLLKLTDHVTHNFPFTQNQLWCIQRTTNQIDQLVFGVGGGDENGHVVLEIEETELRLLSLAYKYKTVFCMNYIRD